jgi:outer membrane lipase/esterase
MRCTRKKICTLLLCSTVFFFGCEGAASTVNQVIVFGDSLSDLGFQDELGPIIRKSPLWTSPGGESWPFYLVHDLKLKTITVNNSTQPNQKNTFVSALGMGDDYAAGGAVTDGVGIGTANYIPPSMSQQVNHYLEKSVAEDKSLTLAILWGGANDIFMTLSATDPSLAAIRGAKQAADNINDCAKRLIQQGVSRVIVMNLPDLGRVPFAQKQKEKKPDLPNLLTAASNAFNTQLRLQLAKGVEIFDVKNMLDTLLANKSISIGDQVVSFDNVTDSSCTYDLNKGIESISALNCIPPVRESSENYLFEDGLHPTDSGHQIIAAKLVEFIEAENSH